MWPDWPPGEDNIEYADPASEYAAIDASVFFAPYNRVHLKKCPECGDTYINATYLKEHTARDHAAKNTAKNSASATPGQRSLVTARESATHPAYVRPASVPAPADAATVRPLRPEAEAEVPMRPEPDSTPPARIPRRRGGPRSEPKPR
jgi:hypothetical protein